MGSNPTPSAIVDRAPALVPEGIGTGARSRSGFRKPARPPAVALRCPAMPHRAYMKRLWTNDHHSGFMARVTKPPTTRARSEKDPELLAFGRHLRELRLARSLTQEALATAAGLHWTYIGQIERGERNLTLKNVLRLAHGLGISSGALLQGAFGNP